MMAQQRMKKGPYKKILIRVPHDIYAELEHASSSQDRSVNGQLVHVLREWADQQQTTNEQPQAAQKPPRKLRPA